ncbi:MAG: hypothetical protein ACLRMJ_04515 [Alistipes finegoldii]
MRSGMVLGGQGTGKPDGVADQDTDCFDDIFCATWCVCRVDMRTEVRCAADADEMEGFAAAYVFDW